jgi:Protein of unknown function (DUF3501)
MDSDISPRLTRSDLMSLEQYAEDRATFREQVLAHKQRRAVPVGPDATLYFEDRLTIQYQIQEMLRIEKIFESEGIQDELDAYNPLVPDGDNLKATFMLEIPDADERRVRLAELIGIEGRVWLQVRDERVFAIADEDLDRSDGDKTSAVHFMRFQLSAFMIDALAEGSDISMGIDHPHYQHSLESVDDAVRESLVADLN